MSKPKFDPTKPFKESKPKFDPSKPFEAIAEPEADLGEQVAQTARSAVEGVTMGLSEPVFSGINAVTGALWSAAQESKDPIEFAQKIADLDRLRTSYSQDVERRRKFEAENPIKSGTAEMAGAIAPMVFTGGTSMAAKAVTALPEAITAVGKGTTEAIRQLPKAVPLLESSGLAGSAARIVESGASAAAQAATQDLIKKAAQVPTGFIQPQDEVPSVAETAMFGAKFGAGLAALPEVATQGARAAQAMGKGAARVIGGVKGDVIDAYLANPERIKNAKSIEEIKIEVDSTMQALRDDVENAVISKDQAKIALKEAESALDDLLRENKNLIQSQKADIKQSLREAERDLNRAFKEKVSEIKTARLPIQADDVLDSVENVKTQVSDLSKESYKLLDAHKGKFSLKGANNEIKKIQKDLKVGNQLLSKDSETAFNTLQKWQEKLGAVAGGTGLKGGEVKKIIQELDSDIRQYGDKLAGDFSDKTYNSLMQVRRVLDYRIKNEVAGYAEIMEETAKMNQLRAQFSKLFGKREAVISKLNQIDSPNKIVEREALKQLGESTGKDFSTPLKEYISTKALSRTPVALEGLRQSLPEQEAYKASLAMSARASRPEYGRDILLKAETSSPQAQAVRQAGQAFSQADEALGAARGALEPYKKITPQNSENVIRTLLGDRTRKIELKNMMRSLSQVTDQDFINMIEDLRVKEAFEKPAVQGSRNVNLWALVTGAFGAVMGDPTLGIASAGAGAQVGAFMDMYGPKVTRRVLDGIVAMRGMPNVQKINSAFADIPEPVKKDLRDSLIRMVVAGNNSSGVVIPDDMKIEVAQDIKDSKNLSNIEKAKTITEMNKTGSVDSTVMQKVMIGEEKPEEVKEPIQQQSPPVDRLKNVTDFIKSKKVEAY